MRSLYTRPYALWESISNSSRSPSSSVNQQEIPLPPPSLSPSLPEAVRGAHTQRGTETAVRLLDDVVRYWNDGAPTEGAPPPWALAVWTHTR